GRELRRDGEAVAVVQHVVAGYRGVDGEEERVESGVGRAVDQTVGDLALLHHVQLVPEARVRRRGTDVLDGRGPEGAQRERDAGGRGGTGPGDLTFGLHEPGEADRGRSRTAGRPSRRARSSTDRGQRRR